MQILGGPVHWGAVELNGSTVLHVAHTMPQQEACLSSTVTGCIARAVVGQGIRLLQIWPQTVWGSKIAGPEKSWLKLQRPFEVSYVCELQGGQLGNRYSQRRAKVSAYAPRETTAPWTLSYLV